MAYQKGQSGNPAGRKPGSMNRTTAMIRAACPDVLAAMIERARDGDPQAAALILNRGVPNLKATIEPVEILTAAQLEAMTPAQRADAVNVAALAGRVPPDVSAALLDGIAKGCAIVESSELAERVAELEAQAQAQQHGGHRQW